MSPKTYIWLIGFASVLALVSFLAILFLFPPESASGFVLMLFFSSLFLALCGFFSLTNFYFRRRRQRNNSPVYSLGISFREGTLLSALLVGFLAMKYFQVFYWWTALIFLIVVVAIEMAFLYQEE